MILRSFLFLLVLLAAPALAEERILSYHADIAIEVDGGMTVTEQISVTAEGQQIKRGIYRDFPTTYKDRANNQYEVGFEVLGVRHNGNAADWHTERRDNGVRIYVGNRDRRIPHGQHDYEIRYRTTRQLGYFADFDELYWNVTGTRWIFPIDKASARVRLPAPVDAGLLRLAAYTGRQGSNESAAAWEPAPDGAFFRTTRPLGAFEGLTIAVGWPKGIVAEPTQGDRMRWLLQDNRHLVVGTVGFLVVLGYYLAAWWRVGRDPAAGAIYPQYAPPADISPAAVRYIREMKYDEAAFVAAIVNLAVKGYLEIEDRDKQYRVRKVATDSPVELAPGEAALADVLFGRAEEVTFLQTDHALFRQVLEAHEKTLKLDYNLIYFRSNAVWMIGGIALSIATAMGMAVSATDQATLFTSAFIMIFGVLFGGSLYKQARNVHRLIRGRRLAGIGGILVQVILLGVFMTVFGNFFALAGDELEWFTLSLLGLLFLTNYLFQDWLKAPTLYGRRVLDKVEGFRLYLSVAEEDELQLRNPPELTPERFEALLPYAIALGVEDVWGRRFAEHLAALGDADSYRPGWYSGPHFRAGNIGGFSSSVAAGVGGAIAAASTAPGSSSGSGGGGSSGGGGGGGGGGGW